MDIDSKLWNRLLKASISYEQEETYEDIIEDLKKDGCSQQDVYDLFHELLKYVMDNGTIQQDDAVRDTMDRIVGWCNESYWLFDEFLDT
jgi:hypothetical protein